MAAGYTVASGDINNKAGQLVTSLWDTLDGIRRFKLWLDDSSHNDAYLTGLGFSAADILVLRNTFSDLGGTSGLWAVAHGTVAPAGASNYFFNGKALTGTNYTG